MGDTANFKHLFIEPCVKRISGPWIKGCWQPLTVRQRAGSPHFGREFLAEIVEYLSKDDTSFFRASQNNNGCDRGNSPNMAVSCTKSKCMEESEQVGNKGCLRYIAALNIHKAYGMGSSANKTGVVWPSLSLNISCRIGPKKNCCILDEFADSKLIRTNEKGCLKPITVISKIPVPRSICPTASSR